MDVPRAFPRLKPDEARDWARRSREIAAMPVVNGNWGHMSANIEILKSIMYMLWGGSRADLARHVLIYATERLNEAIGEACPEAEIVPEDGK